MEKFIAQNEPLSNRPQVLEDSCDAVEEIWYNHPFTEDELNEIKTKLADTSIDIAELEQEKADWMESYKSRLKRLIRPKQSILTRSSVNPRISRTSAISSLITRTRKPIIIMVPANLSISGGCNPKKCRNQFLILIVKQEQNHE